MRNTETISQKADRLKDNHRVILTGPNTGLVIGDHDTYTVSRSGERWSCGCRWSRHNGQWRYCSHVVAVRRARKDPASQQPVARLADLLINKGCC